MSAESSMQDQIIEKGDRKDKDDDKNKKDGQNQSSTNTDKNSINDNLELVTSLPSITSLFTSNNIYLNTNNNNDMITMITTYQSKLDSSVLSTALVSYLQTPFSKADSSRIGPIVMDLIMSNVSEDATIVSMYVSIIIIAFVQLKISMVKYDEEKIEEGKMEGGKESSSEEIENSEKSEDNVKVVEGISENAINESKQLSEQNISQRDFNIITLLISKIISFLTIKHSIETIGGICIFTLPNINVFNNWLTRYYFNILPSLILNVAKINLYDLEFNKVYNTCLICKLNEVVINKETLDNIESSYKCNNCGWICIINKTEPIKKIETESKVVLDAEIIENSNLEESSNENNANKDENVEAVEAN